EPANGVAQTAALDLPLDEPHCIIRPAVMRMTQAIHRHDPRMLQAPGDLRLEQEARAESRIIGIGRLDRLERNLALQFRIEPDEDFTVPSLGVGTQDLEAVAGG